MTTLPRSLSFSTALAACFAVLALPAYAGTPKVNVCHAGASLSVSSSAIGGHTGHGDWVVGAEVCGGVSDNPRYIPAKNRRSAAPR